MQLIDSNPIPCRARPASAGIIVAKRTTLPDPADTPAIFPDPADTPADTMDDRLPLNVVSAATSASAELSGSGLDQDPTSTNSDKIKVQKVLELTKGLLFYCLCIKATKFINRK